MTTPKTGPLVAALRQRLRAGGWSGDGVLPPERQLAAEFAVSRATVRTALAALARDGLLSRRQGRGTYLAGQPGALAALRPVVHLVHFRQLGPLSANPFLAALIEALGAQLAARGSGLVLHQLAPGEPLERHLGGAAELPGLRVGGVITVGPPEDTRGLARLRRAEVPVVVIGDPQAAQDPPTVGGDHDGAAEAAVRHLAGHGRRRLALVDGPFSFWSCRRRRAAFQRTLASLGLPEGPVIESVGWLRPAGLEAAGRLAGLRRRPDAVVSFGDYGTFGLIEGLAARGVRIPADLALVAIECHPLIDHVLPLPPTRWDNDFDLLVQRALGRLDDQRRGGVLAPVAPVALVHHPGSTCGCPPA